MTESGKPGFEAPRARALIDAEKRSRRIAVAVAFIVGAVAGAIVTLCVLDALALWP